MGNNKNTQQKIYVLWLRRGVFNLLDDFPIFCVLFWLYIYSEIFHVDAIVLFSHLPLELLLIAHFRPNVYFALKIRIFSINYLVTAFKTLNYRGKNQTFIACETAHRDLSTCQRLSNRCLHTVVSCVLYTTMRFLIDF